MKIALQPFSIFVLIVVEPKSEASTDPTDQTSIPTWAYIGGIAVLSVLVKLKLFFILNFIFFGVLSTTTVCPTHDKV